MVLLETQQFLYTYAASVFLVALHLVHCIVQHLLVISVEAQLYH